MFILLPLLVVTFLRRRAASVHRVLAGAALLYVATFVFTKDWDPWVGRLFIPVVALAASLFATAREPPVATLGDRPRRAPVAAALAARECAEASPRLGGRRRRCSACAASSSRRSFGRRSTRRYETSTGHVGPRQAIGLVRAGDSWAPLSHSVGLTKRG
jgi:hypothetical protein